MVTKVQAPQLTPNNRIYLYQLLSRELGCGKQTFMPAVEEALARDRMTSDDLGFESTRALAQAREAQAREATRARTGAGAGCEK